MRIPRPLQRSHRSRSRAGPPPYRHPRPSQSGHRVGRSSMISSRSSPIPRPSSSTGADGGCGWGLRCCTCSVATRGSRAPSGQGRDDSPARADEAAGGFDSALKAEFDVRQEGNVVGRQTLSGWPPGKCDDMQDRVSLPRSVDSSTAARLAQDRLLPLFAAAPRRFATGRAERSPKRPGLTPGECYNRSVRPGFSTRRRNSHSGRLGSFRNVACREGLTRCSFAARIRIRSLGWNARCPAVARDVGIGR
jgi:hypothetical protein